MTCFTKVLVAAALLAVDGRAATAAPVLDGPPVRTLTNPAHVVSPANSKAGPIPIASLFKSHDSLGAAWSADGAAVIMATDLGGRLNLWRQPLAGGAPVQLTHAEDRQWAPATTRDGHWVIFQSDHGGREIYALYAVSPKGGPVTALTAEPDA